METINAMFHTVYETDGLYNLLDDLAKPCRLTDYLSTWLSENRERTLNTLAGYDFLSWMFQTVINPNRALSISFMNHYRIAEPFEYNCVQDAKEQRVMFRPTAEEEAATEQALGTLEVQVFINHL
jgi:hypothetical protein